jgi:hypothetical protein
MENYPDGKASIQVRERIVAIVNNTTMLLLRINELNKGNA